MGPADIEIYQYDEYIDAGATCADDVDGAIGVQRPAELDNFDTSRPTLPNSPVVLTYLCTDNAGNQAQRQRRLHVLNAQCTDASKRTGMREHLCPGMYVGSDAEPPECSVFGVCSVDNARVDPGARDAPNPAASTSVDTVAPTIRLISRKRDTKMEQTADGVLVLREEITQGEPYIDPGYVCVDQTDGDLSKHVGVYGLSGFDTSRATEEPHILRYTCTDRAGVRSREVQRWITVVPKCGTGVQACFDGSCPLSDSDTCIASEVSVETEDESHPEILKSDGPPVINLVGKAVVDVEYQGYRECTPDLEVTADCDHGATAHDDVDGDLTPYVKACGLNFEKYGISGCTIYGERYPGTYKITFSVMDSAGHEASVTRFVKVLAKCGSGEVRCEDGLTCVREGVPCELDIAPALEMAADPPKSPSPPNVTLLGDRVVSLPRFTPYVKCSPDQVPTKSLPCDLGANAVDEEGGDLQGGLLVCPPETCLLHGCMGHELWRKGVENCLNASAPIGTVFNVPFVAFDTTGAYASDVRSVIISAPCAKGQQWCPANSPSGRCEDATCETIAIMTDDENLPSVLIKDIDPLGPVIEWRTPPIDEMPFAFVFGQAPWKSFGEKSNASPLAACHGALSRSYFPDCAATAIDSIDGDVTETLRSYSRGESECTPSVFSAGLCLPGMHHFYLTAFDRDGNQGYGDVALTIEVLQGRFALPLLFQPVHHLACSLLT